MHGSIIYQVDYLFSNSVNAIGTSKHVAKEIAREKITTNAGTGNSRSATWHSIGKHLDIYSYRTADAYRAVWRNVFKYAKENYAVKDIEKLTGEHVAAYLNHKVEDKVAYATFQQYAAAAEKLETALNIYTDAKNVINPHNFSAAIAEVREVAQKTLARSAGHREYAAPKAIIGQLRGNFKIAGRLQLEAGLRIFETNMILKNQLLDGNRLKITKLAGKGGKIRIVHLSFKLYTELSNAIKNSEHNRFEYDKSKYRANLKAAAIATNQPYAGKSSHGLRWNYSQNRMIELQKQGLTRTQALSQVSHEDGHNRADITEHYLG